MVVTDGKSWTEFLSTETFIQTFDKYFDSTINVAFQIDFFKKLREKFIAQVLCKRCIKTARFFSPKKNILAKSIINFQNSEQTTTNCFVFHLVLMY